MPQFGDRAVAVVGHRLDQHGNAADAIAFVCDLVVVDAIRVAAAAFDGAVNGVVWHIRGLCVQNAFAQTSIRVRIAAAGSGRDRDLFDQLGKDLAAFSVRRTFFVLNCVPFRVS